MQDRMLLICIRISGLCQVSSTAGGQAMVKRNDEPIPTVDSTEISPPINRTRLRVMANPSPVPP